MEVVKVMQSMVPQSNSVVVDFVKILQHLDQDQPSEPEWFSAQDERPLSYPAQIVICVKLIVAELKRMKWVGTLKDVHERAGVTHETFTTRMRNREYTMCGSAEHFFHVCPQTQTYQDAFTAADRAGGQQTDDQIRTRQQRYFESAQYLMPTPQRGGGRG